MGANKEREWSIERLPLELESVPSSHDEAFRIALDTLPEPAIILDRDRVILKANSEALARWKPIPPTRSWERASRLSR